MVTILKVVQRILLYGQSDGNNKTHGHKAVRFGEYIENWSLGREPLHDVAGSYSDHGDAEVNREKLQHDS